MLKALSRPWRAPNRSPDPPPAALPEENLGRAVSDRAVIYVDLSDERGRRMIESGGGFNPDCVRMWQLLLAKGGWTHVVDVGANYGEMLVNVDLPPRAKVIAVEPNPRIAPYLERTLREAGVRAEIVRKAVAERIGAAPLLLDRQWSGTTCLVEPGEAVSGNRYELITVPTTTLAELLADGGPASRIRALVKIDVEGHEPQVLQGVMGMIHSLAGFVALAEIFHLSADQLGSILADFDVELYEPASGGFVPVQPATPEYLAELVESGRCYRHDAVLTPRK